MGPSPCIMEKPVSKPARQTCGVRGAGQMGAGSAEASSPAGLDFSTRSLNGSSFPLVPGPSSAIGVNAHRANAHVAAALGPCPRWCCRGQVP